MQRATLSYAPDGRELVMMTFMRLFVLKKAKVRWLRRLTTSTSGRMNAVFEAGVFPYWPDNWMTHLSIKSQ